LQTALALFGCTHWDAKPSNTSGAGATDGGAGAGATAGGTGGSAPLDPAATIRECVPSAGDTALPVEFHWSSSDVLVTPVANDRHPILSVKDPSIVRFEDRWHVFATTADDGGAWSMVYLNFADFSEAPSAPQYYLNENQALVGYHAAPQVFFFAPENKWYLIFQSGQPQYSTNDDISNPAGWTRPVNFFASEPATVREHKGSGGWLDFFVICDESRCHLFFTDDNGELYRSETPIGSFPEGFGEPVIAIQGTKETLFEGSSTYKVNGANQYLTLVEAFGPSGQRFYRSFVSGSLDGEWAPLAATWERPFAGANNVTFASGNAWTRDVSHGELLREGYDQTPTISLGCLRFLYQGVDPAARPAQYFEYPYRLALLTRTE
jgi:endo-1,4-beta-xylanase